MLDWIETLMRLLGVWDDYTDRNDGNEDGNEDGGG